jgi:hypothetical protein
LLGKSVLDGDILSLDPSKLAQLLPERVHENRATRSSASIQETYAEDFRWLLRPGHCPAHYECYNEGDKPHRFSILDCRFWIVGKGLRMKSVHRLFPWVSIQNLKSKSQNYLMTLSARASTFGRTLSEIRNPNIEIRNKPKGAKWNSNPKRPV